MEGGDFFGGTCCKPPSTDHEPMSGTAQYDMGYIGLQGPVPGFGLTSNDWANTRIANSALGQADRAGRPTSGVYQVPPAIMETCHAANSTKDCKYGFSFSKAQLPGQKSQCCFGA